MSVLQSPKATVQLAMLINMLSIGGLMMVMPLGPDFVRYLGMPPSQIGYLSGAATLAAALSGLLAAPFLDRFERKRTLLILLALRFAALASCALADSPAVLIGLFMLSGLMAGPMGAVLMALLLDLIPPAERGRQLAYLGIGFSLAAIVVVPLALELALRAGWAAPFLVFGGLGLLLALLGGWLIPTPARHERVPGGFWPLLRSPLCLTAFAIISVQMAGHFLLVPHFSNYFQFNLDFPREQIGLLYLTGGLGSILAMRLGGRWIDRGGAVRVVLISSGGLSLVTLFGFALPLGLPLYLVFTLFMALSAVRTNSTLTIAAGVPAPHQRAAFMALQGTVSNTAAGLASLASAHYLRAGPDNELIGFNHLAWLYAVAGLGAGLGVLGLLRGLGRRGEPGAATVSTKAAKSAGSS